MKPFFTAFALSASEERVLPLCGAIKIFSVSGTVTLSFNAGDAVPVRQGDVFELPFGIVFDKPKVVTTPGSSATVIFGNGSFGGSGGASTGGTAGLTGTGSPEGVQTADPGTTYFDTAASGFWVKGTGTGNTGWVQLIA
jgi:hypothetical protein